MELFVDNLSIYVVEGILPKGLEDLLLPSSVFNMNSEVLSKIASKPTSDRHLRAATEKKLETLLMGLDIYRQAQGAHSSQFALKFECHVVLISHFLGYSRLMLFGD